MGFLQRGFAWGNRRGFAAKMLSPEIILRLISFTKQMLGGGGKLSQGFIPFTIGELLLGHGSYPDNIGIERGFNALYTTLDTLQGGGSQVVRTETMLTTTAILALGSYP